MRVGMGLPYIMFSRQDAGQIGNNGTLAGPIHALASETYQAIIYGDFSIDAEWDAYVQNLKTMGGTTDRHLSRLCR